MRKEFPTLSPLLNIMEQHSASDMYLTVDCPASIRIDNKIAAINEQLLTEKEIEQYIEEVLDEDQHDTFRDVLEFNTAIQPNERSRFRVNILRQQMMSAIVIRRIQTDIPSLDSLTLPSIIGDLVMQERGLILVVGGTGSGKSTTLAAMIGHRNTHGQGHIVTIEDPIEFVHQHKQCIITQRELGIDTFSYGIALKNILRQRPDVVLIGEIRDAETMEHAISFSETGHLVLATLHANNASQTLERIISFFPKDQHAQVLVNLSLNLKAIFAQRLVESLDNSRCLALEIMLNEGAISSLIEEGDVKKIKEIIERSEDRGMQSFDQHLLKMLHNGEISEAIAVSQANNPANVRLRIRQSQGAAQSKRLQMDSKSTDVNDF